jgi:DNA polymerase III delta prime subunit
MISMKIHSILGHEKEEAMLARTVASDRIFPTWIFYGPLGVGKASIANKFAKCLLSCTVSENGTLDINPENPIHKLVDLRTHPDFFVLEQRGESISIDETRKLLSRVRKSPALSRRRVMILENISNLNKNIHNSLLKMLEEPPKDTVVIMICNHIGAVPKTLLSRAVKVYFRPLSESMVKQILDDRNLEDSEILARLSEGSVGYALHLNDNNGIEIYNNILKGFFSDGNLYQKTLKWIIDNNLCNNFEIIKTSILRILKIYTDMLSDAANENFREEIEILKPMVDAKRSYPDREIKKIQEIISMIGMCNSMILDKNAVVVNVFERFFR